MHVLNNRKYCSMSCALHALATHLELCVHLHLWCADSTTRDLKVCSTVTSHGCCWLERLRVPKLIRVSLALRAPPSQCCCGPNTHKCPLGERWALPSSEREGHFVHDLYLFFLSSEVHRIPLRFGIQSVTSLSFRSFITRWTSWSTLFCANQSAVCM